MTLDELIGELKGIRAAYPEFADCVVEIDCEHASGGVTRIVAEEFEFTKTVSRYLTIRAAEGPCGLPGLVCRAGGPWTGHGDLGLPVQES